MIIPIIKKELHRVFTDKRLIISLFIIPMLSIFIIYGLLGLFTSTKINDEDVVIVTKNINTNSSSLNLPSDFFPSQWSVYCYENGYSAANTDRPWSVEEGNVHVYVEYLNRTFTITYDKGNEISVYAYEKVLDLLDAYCQDKNQNALKNYYISKPIIVNSSAKSAAIMASGLVTMLIVSFIFQGATSIGADSIAGEKERLTLASNLMAPIKRKDLVVGKMIGISIITLLSAASSFIGLLLTLPINSSLFGASLRLGIIDFLCLLVALVSFTIVVVAIISLLSTIAKTTKEASSYISPLYLFCTVISLLLLVNINLNEAYILYYIPLINNILLIFNVLSGNFDMIYFLITVITSVIFIVVFEGIITKLFQDEKIVF